MNNGKMATLLQFAFMCHRRPDRSFHCRGKQFPICARCTGILLGYFFGYGSAFFTGVISVYYALLLCVPLIIDGVIQFLTSYESTNLRRLFTGILTGAGIIYILLFIGSQTVRFGTWIVHSLF